MPDAPSRAHSVDEFERLLEPVVGPAYGTAHQFMRNSADAEELVQDAAVQAFKAFESFHLGTNFRAWFFRILTNLAIHRYRQKQRRPDAVPLEDVSDLFLFEQARKNSATTDPAALVIGRLDQELVSQALEALPEEFRVACTLYFMDEFAYQEIAQITDVPVGTVRSRLHRGRKLLQQSLWHVAQEYGVVTAQEEPV